MIALIDAVNDIVILSRDKDSGMMDWLSLAINLIGVIPLPPTMAAARFSLRPMLAYVRQEIKRGVKGALGDAVISALEQSLNATIMGQLETFVENAQTRLAEIVTNITQKAEEFLEGLASTVHKIAHGELDARADAYIGARYEYDGDGFLIMKQEAGCPRESLRWDAFGRLSSHETEKGLICFRYDPLGRRIAKDSDYRHHEDLHGLNEHQRQKRQEHHNRERGWGQFRYGWDGNTLIWACDLTRHTTQHYLYEPASFVPLAQALSRERIALLQAAPVGEHYDLNEDPVWQSEPSPKPFDALWQYHCDHLGTPRELSDEHGAIAWQAQYRAWGKAKEVLSQAAQSAGLTNPLRFQGQYFDQETGLHYNRHRYYDPALGRFISKDPIGLHGGLNLYAYAPNPTGWVDPLGAGEVARLVHEYDALGNRTATIRPDGHRVDTLRYGSGHVHGLLLNGSALIDIERDDLHREIRRTHRNRLEQTQTYDVRGRLANQLLRGVPKVPPHAMRPAPALAGHILQKRQYEYDRSGQLVRLAQIGEETRYAYDPLGRLIEAASTHGIERFAFDPAGNPLEAPKIAHDAAGTPNLAAHLLNRCKRMFDPGSRLGNAVVTPLLGFGQGLVPMAFALNPVPIAVFFQPGFALFGGIAAIGKNVPVGVGRVHERREVLAVMGAGRVGDDLADELVPLVYVHRELVAMVALAMLLGPGGVSVFLTPLGRLPLGGRGVLFELFFVILSEVLPGGRYQRGVNDLAAPCDEALLEQLGCDAIENRLGPGFANPVLEYPHRGSVGNVGGLG
ncbi:hypothetical protein B566_EDAN019007 [Ephemera danica]|nr:hypothetical protein B566_EDAN019007 [Ephemera danica]